MCTVTFVPLNKSDFVLISNRDEAPNRNSLPPEFYEYKKQELLYPKDIQSNGTWIGLNGNKRLICLLNGAFGLHNRKPKYRLSRGIVVKDLLVCENLKDEIEKYDFYGIEPFTIVIVEWENGIEGYELIWDETTAHFKKLNHEPYIWSSSTLYNESMKKERRDWFNKFKSTKQLNADSLFNFHHQYNLDNLEYGVIMDRGFVKTTSITRVEKNNMEITMEYLDLESNTKHKKSLSNSPATNE